jgi:hypothetical protein
MLLHEGRLQAIGRGALHLLTGPGVIKDQVNFEHHPKHYQSEANGGQILDLKDVTGLLSSQEALYDQILHNRARGL